MKKANQTNA